MPFIDFLIFEMYLETGLCYQNQLVQSAECDMATWAPEHKTGWMDWMGDTTVTTTRAPADRGGLSKC